MLRMDFSCAPTVICDTRQLKVLNLGPSEFVQHFTDMISDFVHQLFDFTVLMKFQKVISSGTNSDLSTLNNILVSFFLE